MNLYLRERGDASVKSNTDLANKSNFHNDPNYPNRRQQRQNADTATEMNMADRMLFRFAFQQVMLQCMAEQNLDALVYPTTNLPPPRLGSPDEPVINGRSDAWNAFGQQGFPAITVPAGFTTAVYETVDGRFIGPVPARLPVGMDIVAKPFAEPLLLRIASAYEAATRRRVPPPAFGPILKTTNSSY
jgi:Asp-tRNA(Asn)/Glu-tRNA(Gln) amidotransferase A subunit family amidase